MPRKYAGFTQTQDNGRLYPLNVLIGDVVIRGTSLAARQPALISAPVI